MVNDCGINQPAGFNDPVTIPCVPIMGYQWWDLSFLRKSGVLQSALHNRFFALLWVSCLIRLKSFLPYQSAVAPYVIRLMANPFVMNPEKNPNCAVFLIPGIHPGQNATQSKPCSGFL